MSNSEILNQPELVTITRSRRVNAIINQETDIQVSKKDWLEAMSMHGDDKEAALLYVQCNKETIIKSDEIDIDDINATFDFELAVDID